MHGGAFQAGSKEMYHAWGKYLAENGIALLTINYQLATPNRPTYKTSIESIDDGINFLVDLANELDLDPTNIGIMGDSAGGHFGCLAAFDNEKSSAKIKFVVSAYGVLDIFEWEDYTGKTRTDFVVEKYFGARANTAHELYQNANPMYLIDNAAKNPMFKTKFLLTWGEDDQIVLKENNTIKFIEKLKTNNIEHIALPVKGYGHFWFTKNDTSDNLEFAQPVKNIAPQILEFAKSIFNQVYMSDPTSK